jgi:hypothetical protein
VKEGRIVLSFVVKVEELVDEEEALVDCVHVGVHRQKHFLEDTLVVHNLCKYR